MLLALLTGAPGLLQAACQPNWENEVCKAAGEAITLEWTWPTADEADIAGFALYRQTGLTAAPAKIASVPKTARQLAYIMPAGTTKQYRLRIVAQIANSNGSVVSSSPAGVEIVVSRK